jgi:ligand-binding SRPBCC domain-containing protein
MKTHSFDSDLWVPLPIETVFSFFSDAHNLERITPPFLKFNVVTPDPIVMAVGTRIRYRLSLRGIPISWESEITTWEPPHRFVDEQRRGPYRYWKHEHQFAQRDKGTQVSDHLQYAVWGGSLINSLFVAPDVRKIFAYRREQLTVILQSTPQSAIAR